MWYSYTIEYYSAINESVVSIHTIIRMNFKNIVLGEAKHKVSQITKYHLYEMSKTDKSVETDRRLKLFRGFRRQERAIGSNL